MSGERGLLVRLAAALLAGGAASSGWAQGASPQWRVAPEPLLSLGGANAPESQEFYRIVSTLRRRDGTVLVTDGGLLGRGFIGVRAFGPNGAFLWQAGGSGQGPGEFGGIWWVKLEADTLVLYDARQRRITHLGPDGKLVRDVSVVQFPQTAALTGRFENGDFLARGQTAPTPPRDTVTYFAVAATSGKRLQLAKSPGNELVGNGGVFQGLVFGRTAIAVLDDDRLYFGDGWDPTVSAVRQDGTTLSAIRWQQERIRVTQVDRKREQVTRDAARAASGRPAERTMDGKLVQPPSLQFADFFPVWRRLRVDPSHNLWIERYPRPGEPSTWLIFDSAGKRLASVTMPDRFRLLEAGHDYVLGVWLDEDDVEHVRMFRLGKAPP